jgi:hypothetical protein
MGSKNNITPSKITKRNVRFMDIPVRLKNIWGLIIAQPFQTLLFTNHHYNEISLA